MYPPAFVAGGGQTRRAERGMGGQYFGRREKKDCPLTMISLRSNICIHIEHAQILRAQIPTSPTSYLLYFEVSLIFS